MDPLSLTANLAAVIGLIDTICRIGKETYQLIAAVKNVPAEIQQLQVEMHEVEFLLENVHRYCDEYQDRLPSLSLQKTSPVMHIYSTLKSLEKEYDNIAAIVAKNLDVESGRTRQKLKMVGGRVKLVLGGKLERIGKVGVVYRPGKLGFKLTVTSFNDLAVQNRLDSIHDAVSIIRDSSQILPHSHPDDKPLAWSEKGQPPSDFSQSLEAIDALMAQLTAMKIRIEKQDDKTESPMDSWDNFEDVKRASLPLMLLQSKVREALQLLSTPQPGHEKLSDIDVQWVRSELESLLASSHEKAAALIKTSSQKSDNVTRACRRHSAGSTLDKRRNRLQPTQQIVSSQVVLQDSPAGKVSIRVQWTKDADSISARASDILLLLAPNPQVAEDGLLVSLSRLHDGLSKPTITRHVSAYAIVETTSPIFTCIEANDIHSLRLLLKSRDFSPTVRNTENESLLSVASERTSDGANAIYDVRNAFWYRATNYTIHKATLYRILRLFISAGCDINSVALGGSPLHFTVSHTLPGSELINEDEIVALINLLVGSGCDIEHENADGLTPLLYNACIPRWHGVVVLRELLQWGANPHATSHLGEGALHLAMAFSGPESVHGQLEGDSLETRLGILLQAGCDPNLRDGYGHSPSDFALSSPRIWFQWCLAVERVGLSMNDVLGREGVSEDVRPVQGSPSADSDWESCSGSDDEDGSQESMSSDTCSDTEHIFLCWNGFFPWSVPPCCADCGLVCEPDDIKRRKWDAWMVFQGLRAKFMMNNLD
ncbi:ankyrin repeat domain-containing protein [Aspergillus fischeri NRRL 181]|uniref:Ankyrin repeat protein n=1 Tax=Neosartorya fischeri (strain ATCC 1020 / DSM 3700 / CBS 544.65 / FGSC A1164 / JCM 1740 / NRRL 181 / WB 181) TaxID=331117 RepID=A1DFT5_NEOFI|nr:ankyrin repeat protein [Aspergillus fischeri NRRL 181]EAW18242.1 ankyrin repeat protein [Aspergillus fischeri NRRL 181]